MSNRRLVSGKCFAQATAKVSNLSEPAVSLETDVRRMSSDISGPLTEKADGTEPQEPYLP